MNNNNIVKEFFKINNILLVLLNTKSKTCEVFTEQGNKVFNYKDYLKYYSDFFNLSGLDFEKGVSILENIKKAQESSFEVSDTYKTKNGLNINISAQVNKISDDEFIMSMKENQNTQLSINLDQMTKAMSKQYIDNKAKHDALSKTPYLLSMIDIDNFKRVNDEYGQMIGDMILIELVQEIKNELGNKGLVSRVGGDRFLVLYEIDNDYDKVREFLFNFKRNIQNLSSCKSRGMSITLTMGVSRYPLDGEYELLLKKCQKALIRGKNKGRDCFIIYLEEKCGKVTLEDEIKDEIKKIDMVSAKNDVYSLINNINQILADENGIDESVDNALNIIGNYFYIDRMSIARLDIKTLKIKKHHVYYNPKCSTLYEVHCNDDLIAPWGKALGNKKYVQIDDTKLLPDSNPLKELLPVDHTTASMAFDLNLAEKSFGLIRFDMTTGARHWQPEDFQVFLLISQLFASYFQKNYLKETNYKTLFLDPAYECNNFSKMFSDAGDMIISHNVIDYSIIEYEIKNIINYRSIIGKKRMIELVKSMINVFEKHKECIYGKHHDGPFIIFLPTHDKNIIEKLLKEINNVVYDFSKENNLNELEPQAGIYLANAYKDSLIDSITNSNLTRVLNRDKEFLYYTDDIRNTASFRSEMILRIDDALENNEFLLYLQPKISTTTSLLVGAEALTRWNYKFEKILYPDQFISLFEEQGIIEKLDFNVFKNVCRYQNHLIESGLNPVPISVNVSRYVSDFDNYIKTIEEIRNKYNIDPNLIEIEITEGMYYENTSMIFSFIDNLHKIGYKVSMDDFGAGYSNLVSIAKLNFDTIKFDRSFCIDLDNDNVKIMLLKLIELVKIMKMKTLCEGVETKENVEYLTKIGCDSIQGYYYSKPIPWKDFISKYYNND